jgi:hypothetical protein
MPSTTKATKPATPAMIIPVDITWASLVHSW